MKTRMQKVKMQAVAAASLGFACLLIGGCGSSPQGADVSSLSREEQSKMFQNKNISPKMAEMNRKHGGGGPPAGAGAPQGGAPAKPR